MTGFRRLFVAVAALLVVTPAVAVAQPRAVTTVPVLTYNIHHAQGVDGVLNLERIATVISQSGASVVGLQEVDVHWSERSDWVDQAAWLANRLGMEYRFAANLDLDPLTPGDPRRQYGTAILSRYPIKDFSNTLLPLYAGSEQRGLAVATVDVNGQDVRFATTHLSKLTSAERVEQAQKIIQLLAGPTTPTLLTGDLNGVPTSPEIKALTATWKDTWPEAGLGLGLTNPAIFPLSRIDYVLHSPAFKAKSARTPITHAADHLPVAATFELS
ncbi:endonuclease/exonuclease/phosphatase family protein [Kribbella italica]|uniref:Endonuclease/exonuclease/phosphatase family metal-dependent hydrolase n=1 Tax=Kribbella italica TaxID=1540520 RepID=A0A7W9JA23_9ACTN|nr:endonuclease/exonuclease/phosphatase family protein [Kribbella italica]MBB5838130.1 endonuclease/exonuclease/phosphatase family metal-dependent hydrolase [Kribbella italica]